MQKRISSKIRLIRAKKTYTSQEISQVLKVHIRTIQIWHAQGLPRLDPFSRPFLYLGEEIKQFLLQKRQARKHPLKEGEFYCMRCREPRLSLRDSYQIIETNRRIGKQDFMVLVKGICQVCRCTLTRFSTKSRVNCSKLHMASKRRESRLKCQQYTLLNTDLFKGNGNES